MLMKCPKEFPDYNQIEPIYIIQKRKKRKKKKKKLIVQKWFILD